MKTKSIKTLTLSKVSISQLDKIKGGDAHLSTAGPTFSCGQSSKCPTKKQ